MVLRANGNCPKLFARRITLPQLTALCESLAQDTQIDLLDLSYSDYTPVQRLYDPDSASFGDAGAKCISKLIKVNTGLKFLLLEGNSISAVGADAVASGLRSSTGSNLQLLNLAGNPIGDLVRTSLQTTHICLYRRK